MPGAGDYWRRRPDANTVAVATTLPVPPCHRATATGPLSDPGPASGLDSRGGWDIDRGACWARWPGVVMPVACIAAIGRPQVGSLTGCGSGPAERDKEVITGRNGHN